MDPKEALQMIMDAIPDVENYDDAFASLGELVAGTATVNTGLESEWETKYKDLQRKYRERFRENIFGGEAGPASEKGLDAIEETMNHEEVVPELHELDFDGRSE